jgi:hypothetical protein
MLDNRNTERHEMILEQTHAGGAEEWYCPTCGRRFLMQWPPNFKRIVLECGDENAIHTGSKGNDDPERAAEDQTNAPALSDEWQTALDEIAFMAGDDGELEYDWDVDPYEARLYGDEVDNFDFTSFYTEQEESGLSVEMMEALEELDFTVLDRFDED